MAKRDFIRSEEDILIQWAEWLKGRGAELEVEDALASKERRQELKSALIDKCYDPSKGFWFFSHFILGPDPVTNENIYNVLVEEWVQILKDHRFVAIMCPRGHGKSYFFFVLWPLYLSFLFQRTEILAMGNVQKQSRINFKKMKDIVDDNEILSERRSRDAMWNQDEVEYNKSSIYVKSLGGVTRGIHANYVVADDILRDDGTYPMEYIINYFKDSVLPTAQRKKGKLILVGTPQSSEDIFHEFMQGPDGEIITDGRVSAKGFYSKVYRAIIDEPNKKALLPDVLSFDELIHIRDEIQGELGFQKEYMCYCVSDKTAIFPETLLKGKFLDDETHWEEMPEPGVDYVVSADVATSGAASADFSAYVVLKILRNEDNRKQVVNIVHKKGIEVATQVDMLQELAHRFNNAKVLVEKNNVGVALIQELIRRNVNVEEFVTDRPKKEGAIRYLQNEIRRGRLTAPSNIDMVPELKSLYEELRSFGIRIKRGKERMEALSGHDDLVDALWLANIAAQSSVSSPAVAIVQN